METIYYTQTEIFLIIQLLQFEFLKSKCFIERYFNDNNSKKEITMERHSLIINTTIILWLNHKMGTHPSSFKQPFFAQKSFLTCFQLSSGAANSRHLPPRHHLHPPATFWTLLTVWGCTTSFCYSRHFVMALAMAILATLKKTLPKLYFG